MGYHVYDLTKFKLSTLGRHRTYLFLFTQARDATLGFAEQIGEKAVSITNGINDVDWLFAAGRPQWASAHAFYYASILVICPRKSDAEMFLRAFRQLQGWYESLSEVAEAAAPPVAMTSFNEFAIVSIPRTHNPMFAGFDQSGRTEECIHLHDSVLSVVARLVHKGFARKAVAEGDFELLRERIQTLSKLDTYLYRNAILADTLGGSVIPIAERLQEGLKSTYSGIFDELRCIKTALAELPQTTETNELLRELSQLRKAIRQDRATIMGWRDKDEGKTAVTVQASVGFEMFGNGAKVVFHSKGIPTTPLDHVRRLFGRLGRLKEKRENPEQIAIDDELE